jgi:membrane protein DedA with SNARE-associated domain
VEEFLRRLAEWYHEYGYPVLFFGVMLENAGIPVPGETAVLVAGFLCSDAGKEFIGLDATHHQFRLIWVIPLTILAAVLGDNLGYWLGKRWARPRLQVSRRFLFLTPKALENFERYFDRFGTWTIFFARFITGLRVMGAMAAGTAGMPWGRFFFANASGAAVWATAISLIGFYSGEYLPTVAKWIGRTGMIALVAIVLVAVLFHFWRKWKTSTIETKQ